MKRPLYAQRTVPKVVTFSEILKLNEGKVLQLLTLGGNLNFTLFKSQESLAYIRKDGTNVAK